VRSRSPHRGDLEMIAQAEHLFGYVEYALGNMNAARDQFTHSVKGFAC
jgi:hypothetical protein